MLLKFSKGGLTLKKEPSQEEPLMDFEQENSVLEFSCLEVDSGSNMEDGVEAHEVSTAAVQAREKRFHVKIWVSRALEIWQQIFACLLGV